MSTRLYSSFQINGASGISTLKSKKIFLTCRMKNIYPSLSMPDFLSLIICANNSLIISSRCNLSTFCCITNFTSKIRGCPSIQWKNFHIFGFRLSPPRPLAFLRSLCPTFMRSHAVLLFRNLPDLPNSLLSSRHIRTVPKTFYI